MNDNEHLKQLRRYEAWEVVEMLNLKKTWLKRWVTDHRVPHQRSGEERGVWFTYDDIEAIGRMLPELMPGTHPDRRAEASEVTGLVDTDLDAGATAALTEQELSGFASLVSLRA